MKTTLTLVLVYQAGIANLFSVKLNPAKCSKAELAAVAALQGPAHETAKQAICLLSHARESARVYQGDFRTAEAMARGAKLAGATVYSAGCNRAGDVQGEQWTIALDTLPFSEDFRPVNS